MTVEDQLRAKLRACIQESGRHQVTVAADLGLSTKHLCAMLTGRARLTLDWAEKIAAACGREIMVAVVAPDKEERDLREELGSARQTAEDWRESAQAQERRADRVEIALQESRDLARRLLAALDAPRGVNK